MFQLRTGSSQSALLQRHRNGRRVPDVWDNTQQQWSGGSAAQQQEEALGASEAESLDWNAAPEVWENSQQWPGVSSAEQEAFKAADADGEPELWESNEQWPGALSSDGGFRETEALTAGYASDEEGFSPRTVEPAASWQLKADAAAEQEWAEQAEQWLPQDSAASQDRLEGHDLSSLNAEAHTIEIGTDWETANSEDSSTDALNTEAWMQQAGEEAWPDVEELVSGSETGNSVEQSSADYFPDREATGDELADESASVAAAWTSKEDDEIWARQSESTTHHYSAAIEESESPKTKIGLVEDSEERFAGNQWGQAMQIDDSESSEQGSQDLDEDLVEAALAAEEVLA